MKTKLFSTRILILIFSLLFAMGAAGMSIGAIALVTCDHRYSTEPDYVPGEVIRLWTPDSEPEVDSVAPVRTGI